MNRVLAFFSHGIVALAAVYVTAVVMQIDRGVPASAAVKNVFTTEDAAMSVSGQFTMMAFVVVFSILAAVAVRK